MADELSWLANRGVAQPSASGLEKPEKAREARL